MKLTISKESLVEQLSHVAGAVEKKQTSKILENVLIQLEQDKLKFVGTDLEIEMSTDIDIQAESSGRITAPARKLLDICKALPNDSFVLLELINDRLNIKSKRSRFELATLPADEFPILDDIPISQEFEIPENKLKQLFDHVSFSMANQDVRYYLNGLLLDFDSSQLTVVATDGHRLANLLVSNISLGSEEQYVLPERAVTVLQKILDDKDVKVYLSKTHMSFKLNGYELISRLIKQKYPDYNSVIPLENEFELKLETKELHDVIKRMMLFSTTNTRRVKFSVSEGNLEVSAEDLDIGASGTENIQCKYSGDPIEIGFNSGYVHDVLSHLGSEKEIIFKLHSATKAVIVLPVENKENYELMMLLMPVRLNN